MGIDIYGKSSQTKWCGMKRQVLLFLLGLGFGSFMLKGQTNTITTFLRVEKIPGLNFGLAFSETNDMGFVGTGQDDGPGGHGMCDLYVMKVDECGVTQWYYRYGGPDEEGGKFVRQTSDGGYIIAGLARSWGAGNYDSWLVRLNAQGQLQWSRTFGTIYDDFGLCTAQTPDGGFLMSGFWGGPRTGFILKTDAFGVPVWQRNVGLSNAWVNYVEALPGGDIFIAGQYIGPYGGQDIFAARLDALGNPIWTRSYGMAGNDGIDWDLAGKISPSGNLLLSATTASMGQGNDLLLMNLDGNSGNLQWAKVMQGSGDDRSHFINYTSNNLILQSGYTTSWGNGGADVLFNVYDTLGNRLWSKTYGSNSLDKGWGIQETQDGGFLVSASTQGFGALYFDPMFIKVDSLGGLANCPYSTTPNPTMLTPNISSGLQNPAYGPISILTASPSPPPISIVPNSDIICFNCSNLPQFAVSDTSICLGDSIVLWNNTTVGLICSQEWEINDSSGVLMVSLPGTDSLVYYFSQEGRYLIRLQATCNNVTNYDSIEVVIRPKPEASMTLSPVCLNAQPSQFSGASTFFPTQWSWNFGDGNSGNQQNPSHTYALPGSYPVQLLVTNVYGCLDTIVDTLSIYPVPAVSIQAPGNLCFGQTSTATVQINGGLAPYSQVWNTGDTTASIPILATGTIGLTVQVVDGNGCVALLANDTVLVSPPIVVMAMPDDTICFGHTANIGASLQGGNGNGSISWTNGVAPGPGPHAVSPNQTTTYIATATDGCTVPDDIDTITVVVYPLPSVSFLANPNEGCQPLSVQFQSNSSISSGQLSSFLWLFGDGGSANNSTAVHTFNNHGTFPVTLVVTSDQGCVDSITPPGIIVHPLPVPGFTYPLPLCAGDLLALTNTSTVAPPSSITGYAWNIASPAGYINSSNQQNPSFSNLPVGPFQIQLQVVSDKGCSDTLILAGSVALKPEALFTYNALCPFENEYFDQTTGGTPPYSLAWDWNNDGLADTTSSSFIYIHPQSSNQQMGLTVLDAQGCQSNFVLPVVVLDSLDLPKMPNVLLRNPSVLGNDCWDFEVFAPGFNPCVDYDFYVYNRWGLLVFKTENTKANPDLICQRCFCGQSTANEPLSSGVYYYILKGKGEFGQGVELQGQLMLME
jgi:PKD repeat protein